MRPSRVLELKLDLEKMTATRVWSFTHPSKLSSMCCGGIQIVDNGKGRPQTVLIGWGNGGPFFTEVTHEDRPRIVREFEGLAASAIAAPLGKACANRCRQRSRPLKARPPVGSP
mmetsp:Transcript_48195/g.120659  ORF Transcript_48195/g.120659 Transcript_48195/m.120659 type:complete len:114 (+) Transcript_48195:1416-1757(+)